VKTTIFGTTQYSLIESIKQGGEVGRRALGEWYETSRPLIRRYIIRCFPGLISRADELVDEFIHERVVDGPFFDRYERRPGKRFRSYLKASLKHHCIDALRSDNRHGGCAFSLEADLDAPDSLAPDDFEKLWARQVLAQAIWRVRKECIRSQAVTKKRAWAVLEARFLRPLRGKPEIPYSELVARYGFSSPKTAQNAAVDGKEMLEDAIRSVVSRYAGSDDTDSEIGDLRRILSDCNESYRANRHHIKR
jgi:DNA-directed RNA polymerase specialized sigma24 family protein